MNPLVLSGHRRTTFGFPKMTLTKWNRLQDHVPQRLQFLWGERIPLGAITLLEGDPGTGKSTLLADLGARLTTGESMPLDTGPALEGGVVLLTGEDSLDRIALSYQVAGGDANQVIVLDRSSKILLPSGGDMLREAALEVDARLIVIDPISDFLASSINNEQGVRRALAPLAELAQELNLAVVLVRHLRKSGQGNAVYAGGGSIALSGIARSVLLVGHNPLDANTRVVTVSKSNVAKPTSIAYSLDSVSEHDSMLVRWHGLVDIEPDEILVKSNSNITSQLSEAQEALFSLLEAEPLKSTDVFKFCAAQGISKTTMKRAKKSMGVRAVRRGFGAQQVWWWCLPHDVNRLKLVKARLLDQTCEELFGGDLLKGLAANESINEDDMNSPRDWQDKDDDNCQDFDLS